MEVAVSLFLAFALSVGLNIWLARQIGQIRREASEKDDLIDDLRAAIGGTSSGDDWKKLTL